MRNGTARSGIGTPNQGFDRYTCADSLPTTALPLTEVTPEMNETRSDSKGTRNIDRIAAMQDYVLYRDLAWEGTFEDYLEIVRKRPQVTRNAFQRVYDMIISYGTEEYIDNKKKLVRYNFFKDEIDGGKDAIFGLDIPLMRLVHVLRAASEGFGPEKRVILLHGPVGSSKSTIARLLKKGIEHYSRTQDGALYTFKWIGLAQHGLAGKDGDGDVFPCPMQRRSGAIRRSGSSGSRTTSTR